MTDTNDRGQTFGRKIHPCGMKFSARLSKLLTAHFDLCFYILSPRDNIVIGRRYPGRRGCRQL